MSPSVIVQVAEKDLSLMSKTEMQDSNNRGGYLSKNIQCEEDLITAFRPDNT